MPAAAELRRIRLPLDASAKRGALRCALTGKQPFWWRGEDVSFEIMATWGPGNAADVSGVSRVWVEVKADRSEGGSNLMQGSSTDIDADATYAGFQADTAQHAVVTFAAGDAALSLGSETEKEFWCTIWIESEGGEKQVLHAGWITVKGAAMGGAAPSGAGSGIAILSGGTYIHVKVNLAATEDPGTGDDSAAGYAVGSRWVNLTDDTEFVCLDASEGAAVWKETTATALGGSAAWGGITGTLGNQTDLQEALDAKADSADLGALAPLDTVGTDEIDDDAVTSAKVSDGVIAALAKIASAIRLGAGTKLATVKEGEGTPGTLMAFGLDGAAEDYDLASELMSYATGSELSAHASDTDNPHEVTKAQVGLANVPNVDFAAMLTVATRLILDSLSATAIDAANRQLYAGGNILDWTAAGIRIGGAGARVDQILTDLTGASANTKLASALAIKSYVDAAIANLVDSAPGALNTLNELAASLGDNADFAGTVMNALAGKQPLDATLTAIAAVTFAADKLLYATGDDTFATTDLSAFARQLIDDADAPAMRSTLGLAALAVLATVGTSQIDDSAVTLAKMANLDQATIIGRASGAGTGAPTALTAAQVVTILAASAAQAKAASSSSVALTPASLASFLAPQTLTDAATVAFDVSLGVNGNLSIGGNRTLGSPTNLFAGACGTIRIAQTTGGHTLAYHADWKFAGGSAPTLSTGAGDVDTLDWSYDGTTLRAVLSNDYS